MKITLRKAASLQAEATRILQQNKSDIWRTIVKPTQAPDQMAYIALIDDRRSDAEAKFRDRENLISAIYEIREKVGEANQTTGVNALLVEQAKITMLLDEVPVGADPFGMSVEATPPFVEVKSNLDRAQNPNNHYADSNVTVSLLDDEKISSLKVWQSELTRRRQTIKDELLRINMICDITLSDRAADILTKVNLI